jgi:hypothetical protein
MAKDVLQHFETACVLPKIANKYYAKDFTNSTVRTGTSIQIPKPARFATTSGAVASFPDITEESTTLTVAQWNASFAPTSVEMTTSVSRAEFSERYLRPMAIALAAKVDSVGYTTALTSIANSVGTPGVVPSALSTVLNARARAKLFSMPKEDVSVILGTDAEAGMLDAMKTFFNPVSDISKQYQSGNLGMAYGMKWNSDDIIGSRTVGINTGTPLVDGASQTGATLVTKGWTNSQTGILKAGDIFTVAGVYSVHPVTKVSTGKLQQFVVTADANSGSSTGPATLSIFPSIVLASGATPTLATVSASPADGAAITVVGTGGTVGVPSYVMHRDALILGCIPMVTYGGLDKSAVEYDSDTGISIRITQGMDVTNDKLLVRADVLFGWAAGRPEWACRIEG